MTSRPCLSCGVPSPTTRCADCEGARTRARDHDRNPRRRGYYDSRWQRLSVRARQLQRFCNEPGCGHPGSPENPLTCHHLTWPATKLEHVEVLCLKHNVGRGPTPGAGDLSKNRNHPPFRDPAYGGSTRGANPQRRSPTPPSQPDFGSHFGGAA